jgi:hypothetical protein
MPPTTAAILLIVLALWLVALRESWRAMRPSRLLLNGRYEEARQFAERLEKSWMAKVFSTIRLSARYTIASALHLEGQLKESLEAFDRIRREEGKTLNKSKMTNLRYAIGSFEAASLVLLDQDPGKTVSLLEKAPRREQEDLLLLAHAKLAEGKGEESDRLFRAAGKDFKGTNQAAATEQERTIFHALRGLFLLKIDRRTEARHDLELASGASITNVYVKRARQELENLPSGTSLDEEDDGGPSSLAPQVVESEKDVSKT